MRVLVVGSGGREHALAWKLAQSPLLEELHAAPGNPGIARLAQCHPIRAEDAEGLLGLSRSLEVDLVVVGPEVPLVLGLADALRRFGVSVFGPSAAAARIEGSKAFAKEVLALPESRPPRALPLARPPCVLKADGLAAGKGVFVCRTQEDVDAGARARSRASAATSSSRSCSRAPRSRCSRSATAPTRSPSCRRRTSSARTTATRARTRAAWARTRPFPDVGTRRSRSSSSASTGPVLAELERRGAPFVGSLYRRADADRRRPAVLEFNCRFGDPETQALVPLLDGDLLEALAARRGAGTSRGVDARRSARAPP